MPEQAEENRWANKVPPTIVSRQINLVQHFVRIPFSVTYSSRQPKVEKLGYGYDAYCFAIENLRLLSKSPNDVLSPVNCLLVLPDSYLDVPSDRVIGKTLCR